MDKAAGFSSSPTSHRQAPESKGLEHADAATPHPGYQALHGATPEASVSLPIPVGDRKVSLLSESAGRDSLGGDPADGSAPPDELAQIVAFFSEGGFDIGSEFEVISAALHGVRSSDRPKDAAEVLLRLAEAPHSTIPWPACPISMACGVALALRQKNYSADDIAALVKTLRTGAEKAAPEGFDDERLQRKAEAVDVGLQLACDPFAYLKTGTDRLGWSRACKLLQARADVHDGHWEQFLIACLRQNLGDWSPAGLAQRAVQMFEFLMHPRGAGVNTIFELGLFLEISAELIAALEACPDWDESVASRELQHTTTDTKRERKHEAPGAAGLPSAAGSNETPPDAVAFASMLERYLQRTGFPAEPADVAERTALAARYKEAASELKEAPQPHSAARRSLIDRYNAVAQRLEGAI